MTTRDSSSRFDAPEEDVSDGEGQVTGSPTDASDTVHDRLRADTDPGSRSGATSLERPRRSSIEPVQRIGEQTDAPPVDPRMAADMERDALDTDGVVGVLDRSDERRTRITSRRSAAVVDVQRAELTPSSTGARGSRVTAPPVTGSHGSKFATPPPTSITTAAEALRDEEVHRTRVFIRIGWLASLAGIGTLPFVDSEPWMVVAFVGALVLGMVVSFGFHQAFRDPRRYGDRPLFVLGVMSTINTHVAILFFGAFSLAPVLIVIGLHFVGRSELAARRAVWLTSAASHAMIAVAIATGMIDDPGVFATIADLGAEGYVIGALYVQGAYALAYFTGTTQREVSLRSIGQLQRTTRIAAQRAALLDELRLDLARAEQAGAGRYTDSELGGYRLGQVLGRGAHGEVYEAMPVGSVGDRDPVAIKVLHHEHLADPMVIARFVREIRATSAIRSAHVARVLATCEDNARVPYYVMDRLHGQTLADRIRRTGKLDASDTRRLLADVADAIDAARDAGIVHRDLKPQNLMFAGGSWKLLDFGVATLADSTGTLTLGGVVGTPQFMSPEQARGVAVDHRSDLYALALIAYRTLTGRNAFGGSDTPAILYAVVHTMPPRPSSLAPLVEDLDRWFAIGLAKDPIARFASGAELVRQLDRALANDLPADLRATADRLVADHPWQEVK